MSSIVVSQKFVRSERGWVAGVCQGLGESFDMSPGLIRLLWLVSILFFGLGLVPYIIAAISFPVRGREAQWRDPKLLGVCVRMADRLQVDIGLIRFATLFIGISSFGVTVIGYILLHFVLSDDEDRPL